MERVLVIGENPFNGTGNGNMLASLLSKADFSKYEITLFLSDLVDVSLIKDTKYLNELPIITANEQNDIWGKSKLAKTISHFNFDSILFVGIDIWRYSEIFDHIETYQKEKGFKWYYLFPYDLPYIRQDWLDWINQIQYPFVYSEYGYNLLKEYTNKIQFFRPEPYLKPLFKPIYSRQDKILIRRKLFGKNSPENNVLFTFIGANQTRKNIGNLIKGFSIHLQEFPNSILYIHSKVQDVYDIEFLRQDYNIPDKNMLIKAENYKMPYEDQHLLYNMSDCIINPTVQEGLSWTVIESLMCGVPVIISESTAHKDYIQDEDDYLISLEPRQTNFLPLMTEKGPRFIESEKAVEPESIAEGMKFYITLLSDKDMRQLLVHTANKWLSKCGTINDILSYETEVNTTFGEFI